MEEATQKGQAQQFFYKKLQRRPRQHMADLVSVFEKALLDMKAEEPIVELNNMDWHLLEKSNVTRERLERVLGAAEGEYEFAAVRGALIKLFPDSIINEEKRPAPDQKPSQVTDHKANDRLRYRH